MPETDTEPFPWSVFELRQYSLLPGRRDDLIALFERHFVESQEEGGMRVLGQFRDLDKPDRFVWMRAFAGMTGRAEALSAFYEHHPAWREHREAANATMVDSDNVLLLRPVAGSGWPDAKTDEVGVRDRPPVETPADTASTEPADAAEAEAQAGADESPSPLVTVGIHHLPDAERLAEFAEFFDQRARPMLSEAGAPPLACWRTEPAENTFPALPVRTAEHVHVRVTRFSSTEEQRASLKRLVALPGWVEDVAPALTRRLARPTEQLRLTPTARSLLR